MQENIFCTLLFPPFSFTWLCEEWLCGFALLLFFAFFYFYNEKYHTVKFVLISRKSRSNQLYMMMFWKLEKKTKNNSLLKADLTILYIIFESNSEQKVLFLYP